MIKLEDLHIIPNGRSLHPFIDSLILTALSLLTLASSEDGSVLVYGNAS